MLLCIDNQYYGNGSDNQTEYHITFTWSGIHIMSLWLESYWTDWTEYLYFIGVNTYNMHFVEIILFLFLTVNCLWINIYFNYEHICCINHFVPCYVLSKSPGMWLLWLSLRLVLHLTACKISTSHLVQDQ